MPGAPWDPLDPNDFTINLYEPEPDTNPLNVEFSSTLLPRLVVSGFAVLQELGTIDPYNSANWSDIVEFRTDSGKSYADFWSDKDIAGWEFDSILVGRVLAGNTKYLLEDHYPTVYTAGVSPFTNVYSIYSIPEPATVGLLGLGALSLLRRKR